MNRLAITLRWKVLQLKKVHMERWGSSILDLLIRVDSYEWIRKGGHQLRVRMGEAVLEVWRENKLKWKTRVDWDGSMRKMSSLRIWTKYLVERCFSVNSDTACSRSDNVHSLWSSQKTVAFAGLPGCERQDWLLLERVVWIGLSEGISYLCLHLLSQLCWRSADGPKTW